MDETERVRGLWDKAAPRFDRSMGFWERVLFRRRSRVGLLAGHRRCA